MIKHIVFWKISSGDPEARQRVFQDFSEKTAALKKTIPEILEARVGLNLEEGARFDICIDSLFDSRKALDAYIAHPEHLKVRAYLNGVTCDKAVFDYEAGDAPSLAKP